MVEGRESKIEYLVIFFIKDIITTLSFYQARRMTKSAFPDDPPEIST